MKLLARGWFNLTIAAGSIVLTVGVFLAAYDGAMSWWVFVTFLLCSLILVFDPKINTRIDELQVDESGVRRRFRARFGKQGEEYVSWEDLWKVGILTTDIGPGAEDFYFLLFSTDGQGVSVSGELAAKHGLLEILQKRLPGFDNMAVVQASSCVENQSFLVWQKT